MDLKRESIFKLIVISFSAVLFFSGAYLLFHFEIVDFEWSREIREKKRYERSKKMAKRVLILGDSQLEKHVADKSLYVQLQDYFEDNNIGYAIASHFGFGTIENFRALKEHAFDFEPDLVILFYNVHNDLTDVIHRSLDDEFTKSHDAYIFEGSDTTGPTITDSAKPEESAKPDIIHKQQTASQAKTEATEKPPVPNEVTLKDFDWKGFEEFGIDTQIIRYAKNRLLYPFSFGPEYVNPHILTIARWQPDYLLINVAMESRTSFEGWQKALKLFEQMLDITDSLDCDFAIVGLPSTVQVDTSHYDFYRRLKMEVSTDLLNSRRPQEFLDTFCRASNIFWLDLLPVFKEISDTLQLYYMNDDHCNNDGHVAAFELVKTNILEPYKNGTLPNQKGSRQEDFYKIYGERFNERLSQ